MLLRTEEDVRIWSVPVSWTDVEGPVDEVAFGGGRSALRVADLLILERLVAEMLDQRGGSEAGK